MLCYECGHVLGSGRYCLRCGADVSLYRKIARLSNRYYNIGLEKAGIRDMSGAADALRRALMIDARNIPARNLLGLVCYETGETVEALCEWVISTHYQPEDNPASAYVEELQNNRRELDQANQAIRKFNVALGQAKNDSPDLALIQLQWVIEQHPKMVKAHELRALILFHTEEYAKAEREVRTLLKLDCGNLLGLKLDGELRELGRRRGTSFSERMSEQTQARLATVRKNVAETREVLSSRPAFWLRFLVGMILLVCMIWGILVPTLNRQKGNAVGEAVIQYAEQMEALRKSGAAAKDLADSYEVMLRMFRLDPTDRAQFEQMVTLFSGLEEYRVDDAAYREMYNYWRNMLPEYEAALMAAEAGTTEAPSSEDEAATAAEE